MMEKILDISVALATGVGRRHHRPAGQPGRGCGLDQRGRRSVVDRAGARRDTRGEGGTDGRFFDRSTHGRHRFRAPGLSRASNDGRLSRPTGHQLDESARFTELQPGA